MSTRNFNDFAATLSFYTPPGGAAQSTMFSSTPSTVASEESKGLMGWARSGFESVRAGADEIMMTRQRLATFGIFMAAGLFCMTLSLTFLPFLLLAPSKFATLFTIGSLLILSSFSVLRGHENFRQHMLSRERLQFSLGYLTSLLGTLYASLWSKGYLLTLIFSISQMVGLAYFLVSYFPGGAQALTYIGGTCAASIKSCFLSRSVAPILPM